MIPIFTRIESVLHSSFGLDHVASTAALSSDLGMSSLDRVEFAMAIEDEFGIVLEDDLSMALTVADVVRIVERKLAIAREAEDAAAAIPFTGELPW